MTANSMVPVSFRYGLAQIILLLSGVGYVLTGAALLLAPQWFFDNIGTFPPFSRHYAGDLGAFILALGLGLLLAVRQPHKQRWLNTSKFTLRCMCPTHWFDTMLAAQMQTCHHANDLGVEHMKSNSATCKDAPIMSEITTEARHPYVSAGNVKTISREELREKLERGDRFKLVMTLGEWAYRSKHISGSLNLYAPEQIPALLDPDDEIVVYCSNPSCWASIKAYYFLQSRGYKNVRRYAGGIADWEEAGYPLEGEMVQSPSAIWP